MKYGTKKDIIIWYSIAVVAMTWAAFAFVGGTAGFIHVLAIVFGFSCIMQPVRNEKKREKKRKQEIMEKAFENMAKGE